MEHVWRNINRLALNLVGPAAIVPNATNNGANISTSHGDGLAIVKGLDGSKELKVLLDQVGKLKQQVSTLLRGNLAPRALEGIASSLDGNVDVGLGGFVDGADDLLGGGIDDLKGLLLDTLDELVVDEAVQVRVRVSGSLWGKKEKPHTVRWAACRCPW